MSSRRVFLWPLGLVLFLACTAFLEAQLNRGVIEAIHDLPLAGRDLQQLVYLVPGCTRGGQNVN